MCESSLLNQALHDDMSRVATEKGCNCGGSNFRFYLPKPLPLTSDAKELHLIGHVYQQHVADLQAASSAFCEYVSCRWPVIVFALDPVTDEQNIADAYSRRREMQLAVSVAVANGNVSPAAAGRFVRRLETDIETIAINRTAVGFSHGNDTFGWRFYPRVQTPPFEGNLATFGETILGPRPNQDIRTRKLEPGTRECHAIVLMPSFVPHATFSSRSNWFSLTNPAHKELTVKDTMELSRAYQSIVTFSSQLRECGEYRPGDVSHMLGVVEQIGRRLPFQNEMVQVPYENTVGGFELFTSGITDLGPELIGFYGEPGVNIDLPKAASDPAAGGAIASVSDAISFDPDMAFNDADARPGLVRGTTLFIVGKHFSVTNTKIIAGGRYVPFRLLSREIAEVMIPPLVNLVPGPDGEQFVDMHVATPYGVSNHLLIPAYRSQAAPEAAIDARLKKLEETGFSAGQKTITFAFDYDRDGMINLDTLAAAQRTPLPLSNDTANVANLLKQVPKQASVVIQPVKADNSIIANENPVSLKRLIPFDDKQRLNVEMNVLTAAVREILENQNDGPATNRFSNGAQGELAFTAAVYIRPDTDSRFSPTNEPLVIKLVQRPETQSKVKVIVPAAPMPNELPPPPPPEEKPFKPDPPQPQEPGDLTEPTPMRLSAPIRIESP